MPSMSYGRVGLTQLVFFARNLSMMLKSGMAISEALGVTEDIESGQLKRVLRRVLSSVDSGRSFSSALGEHPKVFRSIFVHAVRVGESSGMLEENLDDVAEMMEKEKALTAKITAAMTYPAMVVVSAVLLGLLAVFMVLPKITPLFLNFSIELPLSTRVLLSFSQFVQENGGALLVGVVALIIFLTWLFGQKFMHPVTHWTFLRIPLIGNIIREASSARYCRTLGLLLKSGLNLDEAVKIVGATMGNFYYKDASVKMSKAISQGAKFSEYLLSYPILFPKVIGKMVMVAEKSGNIDQTLLYLAEFFDTRVDESTKGFTNFIEPLLLFSVGLFVAFLALAIIGPIYKVTGGLGR